MEYLNYALYVVLAVGGFFIGFFAYQFLIKSKANRAAEKAEKIINEAKIKEKDLLLKAQDKALKIIEKTTGDKKIRW